MRDEQISLPRIHGLHPKVIAAFTKFVEDAEKGLNITLRVTQGFRSISYQDALYAQGRTKPGKIVTNARGGSSYHNYGLAIDLVVMEGKEVNWNYDMKKLVKFMPKGMEWGGNWISIKDLPHFQITLGHNWRELFRLYKDKKFIKGTEYLDI